MGRFSFRAGPDAEDPEFVITMPDGRDKVRRLKVEDDGTVTEESLVVQLPEVDR